MPYVRSCLTLTTAALALAFAGTARAAPPDEPAPPETTVTPVPATAPAPPESAPHATTPAPEATKTSPAEPADEGSTLRIGKARRPDMQDFAEGSRHELHVGGARARYALNLFGDVGLGIASRSLEGAATGPARAEPFIALGVADALFTADLEKNFLATMELTFAQSGGTVHSPLERLQVGYRGKYGFVDAGRFHTDIGYWNAAYHHGRWLQLPIERPRTIALHGGLVPAHWTGVQGGVQIPIAGAQLLVSGSLGNARDDDSAAHGGHTEQKLARFLGGHARVELRDAILKDLRVGVSGVYDRIPGAPAYTRPSLPDVPIDEYVLGAHVAYPSLPFTLIAEGYWIRHTAADFVWNTYGAFALAGYAIGPVTPYAMVEHVRSPGVGTSRDPFYVPEPSSVHGPSVVLRTTQGTLGVRVDVTTWASLKAEYRAIDRADLGTFTHAGLVNASFGL